VRSAFALEREIEGAVALCKILGDCVKLGFFSMLQVLLYTRGGRRGEKIKEY
jgi:hypothetical protein